MFWVVSDWLSTQHHHLRFVYRLLTIRHPKDRSHISSLWPSLGNRWPADKVWKAPLNARPQDNEYWLILWIAIIILLLMKTIPITISITHSLNYMVYKYFTLVFTSSDSLISGWKIHLECYEEQILNAFQVLTCGFSTKEL